MATFLNYLSLVLRWSISHWWKLVCGNFVVSLLIDAIVVLIGAYCHYKIVAYWPSLNEQWGTPMHNIAWYVVYVIIGTFALMAVSFLLVLVSTPSQIHKEQRSEITKFIDGVKAANDELMAEKERSHPKFRAEILQMSTGQDFSSHMPTVFLWVKIANSGAPSVADRWVFKVILDGKEHYGVRREIERTKFQMPDKEWIEIDPSNALYERTTTQPVPSGAVIYGILRYEFSELSLDQLRKTSFSSFALMYDDVLGNTKNAENNLTSEWDGQTNTFPSIKVIRVPPPTEFENESDQH